MRAYLAAPLLARLASRNRCEDREEAALGWARAVTVLLLPRAETVVLLCCCCCAVAAVVLLLCWCLCSCQASRTPTSYQSSKQ